MMKAVSTWFRSRVLHEDLVTPRADVATEQWDEVPFAPPRVGAQADPQAKRRPTPPPLPPAATRPRLTPVRAEPARQPASAPAALSPPGAAEWQEDLLALAKSTVSPVDPADVPTPPPTMIATPPAAPPPPTTPPPPQAAPPTLTSAPPSIAADVPTPPPTLADVPTPPPTITPPRKATPPLAALSQAVPAEDDDWDAVIARAKSGPVKSPRSRP